MQMCIELKDTGETVRSFTVKAQSVVENKCDFQICPKYIPSILLRLLNETDPRTLVSLIPSLGNEIFITFLNLHDDSHVLLQNAIEKFNKLGFCYVLEFVCENYNGIDSSTVRNAYDNFVMKSLEKCGYIITSQNSSNLKYLIQTKKNSALCLKDPILRTQFIDGCFGFSRISKNCINKNTNKLCFHIEGEIVLIKLIHFLKRIPKDQMNALRNNNFTRLDNIPCCVLPNCSVGYVVKIEKIDDSEKLKKYWKYVHGIDLDPIHCLIHITFDYGNEDNVWVYPEQCVLYFSPFNFQRISQEKSEIFSSDFQSLIQKSINTLYQI